MIKVENNEDVSEFVRVYYYNTVNVVNNKMNKLYIEVYENSIKLAILPAHQYLMELRTFDLIIPRLLYCTLRVDPAIYELILPYNSY